MMSPRWIKAKLVISMLMMMMIVKVEAYLNSPRYGHGAVLINKKIYIYGGREVSSTIEPYSIDNSNLNIINEFITLDVSKPFNTDNPPWVVDNNSGTNPNLFNHGITSGGGDLMIIFGGISDTTNTNNSVLWYCHTDKSSKLIQKSTLISSRIFFGGMASDNSKSYLIGGADSLTLEAMLPSQGIATININTIESDIAISNFISSSVASYDHTSTLLDGKVYVIGGVHYYYIESPFYVDMSSIGVYNTKDNTWSTLYATGVIPDPRRAHRAVGYDNTIIIHGGFNGNGDTNNLFKLNVLSLTWEKLNIAGQDPGARHGHTFTLVGTDYIIGTYGLSKTNSLLSNIFILNLKTLSWTNDYSSDKSTSSSSSSSKLIIVWVILGGAIILALIFLYCWIGRRRNSNNNNDPGARHGHTFTLVGTDYIIGTYGLSKTNSLLSNIFILNLKTLSWTNDYSSDKSTSSSSSSSKLIIVWVILGGAIILALIFLYCWIGRRRNSNNNNGGRNSNNNNDDDDNLPVGERFSPRNIVNLTIHVDFRGDNECEG
ncbi:hypothetical protein Glove_86g141 [Diversispora epigaea]|uniref:Galactose oxidase n=1 Tax=Diversispora epigaea TaxID=1348612 RepID=A0A397JAT6_9GLOM|nr:hypothetical protein Glove_86g141 [Diversispora epigaea]